MPWECRPLCQRSIALPEHHACVLTLRRHWRTRTRRRRRQLHRGKLRMDKVLMVILPTFAPTVPQSCPSLLSFWSIMNTYQEEPEELEELDEEADQKGYSSWRNRLGT